MKKFLAGLMIVGLLIAGSSYWWVIQGSWLDQAASLLATKKSHTAVRVKNVRVSKWSQIRFDSLVIASGRGEQWINAGRGEIFLSALSFLTKSPQIFHARLERVIVLKDFYKNGFAIPFTPPQWLEESSVVDELHLRVVKDRLFTGVHILRYRSPSLGLRGGMRFEGKRMTKMHLLVSVSEEVLEKVPGVLRSRLFRTTDGWQGSRIIYCKNTVTAIGHSGPFFKFQWQPQGSIR